jgi:4-amino-4-deoxy-L-arabinose transferase-like glycosyltransferase
VRRSDALALVMAVLGAILSTWVADGVYEGLPHLEDEFAFLWEAEVMAEGHIALVTPNEPRSIIVPFVVDFAGQRFGKYPPGWPAALSLGARLDTPWVVNALLAGLSIWLVYRLGSKIAGRKVGLLAAGLSLSSPMFLMLSGSMLSHTFSLFLTCALAVSWLDLFLPGLEDRAVVQTPHWMQCAVAGLSLGLLVITRPLTAAGVALPFFIHGLAMLVRRGRSVRRWLIAVGVLTILIASLLPLWNAALAGDPWMNPYTLWWEYDRVGFGPGIGVAQSGHNLYWAYWNLRWSLHAGVHDLFGWPYISWIFLPFGLVALRRKWKGWLLFSIFPALLLSYMTYWVGSWLYGPRYYYESLPGLAIVSAMGIAWLGGWMGEVKKGGSFKRVASGSLVLILMAFNILFYLPPRLAMMNQLNGIARSHLEPFERTDLDRAVVIVHTIDRWTEYGTLLTLTAPFADRDLVLAISRGPEADARLASGYSDWDIFHYYPDVPDVFYREPRTTDVMDD